MWIDRCRKDASKIGFPEDSVGLDNDQYLEKSELSVKSTNPDIGVILANMHIPDLLYGYNA